MYLGTHTWTRISHSYKVPTFTSVTVYNVNLSRLQSRTCYLTPRTNNSFKPNYWNFWKSFAS